MQENILSKSFAPFSILRFSFPNIVMMVFLSLYTIVDGMFISRFVSTIALSAVNIAYPISSVQLGIGIMIGTGGSAIIAKKMGEQKIDEARKDFTSFVLFAIILGVIIAFLSLIFLDPILIFLGSSKIQMPLCHVYTYILMFFTPMFFLQAAFQSFFVAAGKPNLGLLAIVLGGIGNVILDYLFMGVFHWGISGAAIATGIGYSVPACIGIFYFTINKNQPLYFEKTKLNFLVLFQGCMNGISEMISNVSVAVTTFLFNLIFMYYWKEEGVAAITIVMYYQFVFSSIFIGFSLGIAPIISYKYGAKDYIQLKKITYFGMFFIVACSIVAYGISILTIRQSLSLFTENKKVFQLVLEGFPVFATSFLLMGISIFASGFFTALNNGIVSGIISFTRTFLFLIICMLLFPYWFGSIGIWWAVPVAELFGVCVSCIFLVTKKKIYHY